MYMRIDGHLRVVKLLSLITFCVSVSGSSCVVMGGKVVCVPTDCMHNNNVCVMKYVGLVDNPVATVTV